MSIMPIRQGSKGTMSEIELHMIKSRLHGAKLNKARAGKLRFTLPVGLAYDYSKNIVLEPDQQVQESFRLLFKKFRQIGTARGVVKYFK
jgi:DNA invertase Pin-like site-specific DNA recombinase